MALTTQSLTLLSLPPDAHTASNTVFEGDAEGVANAVDEVAADDPEEAVEWERG